MRVKSNRPSRNGGWLHRADSKFTVPIIAKPAAPVVFSASQYYEWVSRNDAHTNALKYLHGLCPSYESWHRLGVTWAREHHAWAIPMRDGQENIIGIQLRYLDNQKRAVKGSHNGLFIPSGPASGFALICEGASDTVAALVLGYYAIGRQSCAQGNEMLATLLQRKAVKRIALVSDNDQPGVDGVLRLSETIKLPCCVLVPPAKDLREYVQSGGSRELLNMMMEQSVWRTK